MSTGFIRLAAAGLLCLGSAGLPGCVVVSDNSNDPQNPTVGRELTDLKVARDKGALGEEEYHDARHKVLSRLDKSCGS